MARKQRGNIIAVLDIGTAKVGCYIAKLNNNGKINVLGIGHNISSGIKAGVITDVKALEHSIVQAVESAEKMADETIHKVYVSISPNITELSSIASGELSVAGHDITYKDEKKLLFQVLDRYAEEDIEVIHSFPIEYTLDNQSGIVNPIGMYGSKLSCSYNIIYAHSTNLINILNCIARCQLDVEYYVSASYASGLGCLTQDELEMGTLLLDIGGGCTSLSFFHKGSITMAESIPLGAVHITHDIAIGLSTDYLSAERLKNLYGGVILGANDIYEKIEVPIPGEIMDINVTTRAHLIEIIRARMEEIFELLYKKMVSRYGANIPSSRLVITGGGAQLNGVRELAAEMFGKNVRVGYPTALPGIAQSTSGPAFSTLVGMLLYASDVSNMNVFDKNMKEAGFLYDIVRWLKDNFSIYKTPLERN